MAKLKSVLAKDEFDKLSDALKELYTAEGDSYVLDTDVDAHPRVSGLRTALDKERNAVKSAEKEYRELKAKIGDLDPEKAREAMARIQELQDKKLLDEGKVDELIEARTERLKADHKSQTDAFTKQIGEKDSRIKTLSTRVRRLMLDGTIRQEAIAYGAKPEHVDDIIWRLTEKGVNDVRFDLQEDPHNPDAEPTIVALERGQVKYGKDATKSMPVKEGLELLRDAVPGFFSPNSGGGAENAGGGKQIGKQMVISESDARDRGKWLAANDAAQKAGVPLVVVGG